MAGPSYYSSSDREPIVRERSTYMTDTEAEKLCALFADGLSSGIGYARILSMLERQGADKRLIARLRVALLEKGDMLGEAFARYGILDPSARKLVLVAEQQGKLPQTFKQLGKIYGQRHQRKKRFLFAMVEPMILVILGLIVARNLMSQDLAALTFEAHTESALAAVFLRSAIEGVIFALGCVAVALASLSMPVDFALRSLTHRLMLSIPVIGGPGNLYAVSIFCLYVNQSIASGLTVYKSLELAAEASNAPRIRSRLHVALEMIADGANLAQSLYAMKALPDDVLENIDLGEESGRLEERLAFLAERYAERSDESFQRLLASTLYLLRFAILIIVVISLLLVIVRMPMLKELGNIM